MNQLARNVRVKLFSGTVLATVEGDMNTFLDGGGTPALGDAKVLEIQYRPVDVGGTLTYTAMIAFVE